MPITGNNSILGLCLPNDNQTKIWELFPNRNACLSNLMIGDCNGKIIAVKTEFGSLAIVVDGSIVNVQQQLASLMSHQRYLMCDVAESTQLIFYQLMQLLTTQKEDTVSVEQALKYLLKQVPGGYSLIVQINDEIYACRDCYGVKPLHLVYIQPYTSNPIEYDFDDGQPIIKEAVPNMLCSDFSHIERLNGKFIRHVLPGEIVKLSSPGQCKSLGIVYRPKGDSRTLCSMEYVSLTQSSGILDDQSVHQVRWNLGRQLAVQYAGDSHLQDCTVTSLPSVPQEFLLGFSQKCQWDIINLFYKSNTPSNQVPLGMYPTRLENKSIVVLVDSFFNSDLPHAVNLLNKSGVGSIHLRICSPENKTKCEFGIDFNGTTMPNYDFVKCLNSIGYLDIHTFISTITNEIPLHEVNNIQHCVHCFGVKHPLIDF